jgi:hypothetical protein
MKSKLPTLTLAIAFLSSALLNADPILIYKHTESTKIVYHDVENGNPTRGSLKFADTKYIVRNLTNYNEVIISVSVDGTQKTFDPSVSVRGDYSTVNAYPILERYELAIPRSLYKVEYEPFSFTRSPDPNDPDFPTLDTATLIEHIQGTQTRFLIKASNTFVVAPKTFSGTGYYFSYGPYSDSYLDEDNMMVNFTGTNVQLNTTTHKRALLATLTELANKPGVELGYTGGTISRGVYEVAKWLKAQRYVEESASGLQ